MTGLLVSLAAGIAAIAVASPASVAGLYQYGVSVRAVQLVAITAGALGMLFLGLRDDESAVHLRDCGAEPPCGRRHRGDRRLPHGKRYIREHMRRERH